MSDVVIKVSNLGKKYRIRQRADRQRYVALRDVLADKTRSMARRLWSFIHRPIPNPTPGHEDFWALKDVSFEIRQGEVLGIIGRNGAGKSTLLKILSRITEPTMGRVEITGRVGSLLEVGTGFHPELTGRENIFLNGAILGMTRAEIAKKFDEIVAFAGVERFLETAVKHYSSGMYVRLAFAVAAHLEPEILVVDEVLAVGDTEFQKKCIGKMGEVSRGGRTVLLVSHQMASILNLARTSFLLQAGRLIHAGPTDEVVRRYIERSGVSELTQLSDRRDRVGDGAIQFTAACLGNGSGRAVTSWISGTPGSLILEFTNRTGRELRHLQISAGIDDAAGSRIVFLHNGLTGCLRDIVSADIDRVEIILQEVPLVAGTYNFTLYAAVGGKIADWIQNAGNIVVEGGDFFGNGQSFPSGQGSFMVRHRFTIGKAPSKLRAETLNRSATP